MSTSNKRKSDAGIPVDPREWKVFPRNLTARAAYIVPGNPVVTRPEDGVDNCYPGLEMDARNIQKFFFPGLYFEVYRENGARLAGLLPIEKAKPWIDLGMQPADLDKNLNLWALKGKMSAAESSEEPALTSCIGKDGLYTWRKSNDLFPGKTAIIIGPDIAQDNQAYKSAVAKLNKNWQSGASFIQRSSDKHEIEWAVFIATRADYLNEEGVLSPDVYQAGELTRTLCTPWTFDFRDCQCFYWASNKPDVIASENGKYEYLNFQRKNRDIEPQTADIAYDYEGRRLREIDYAEMMTDWEQLRPVVSGREIGQSYIPERSPEGPILSFQQIVDEVSYLASVEHALAVQYLYAYYSINTPKEEPSVNPQLEQFRIWKSADTVFNIAIDEMRHFRWANEVLKLLGADTSAKRATKLGRSFKVPFYLQSMVGNQLQWFADLERPSKSTLHGLDGMYVGILTSLQKLSDSQLDKVKKRRAIEIVKLIIDEGEEHYLRFSTVQQNLAFFNDAGRGDIPAYIRSGAWATSSKPTTADLPFTTLYGAPVKAAVGSKQATLQERSDALYQVLLHLLKIIFAVDDSIISGNALRSAISVMFKMNDVNFALANSGAMPLFTLPEGWSQDPAIKSRKHVEKLLDNAEKLLCSDIFTNSSLLEANPDAIHGESLHQVIAHFRKHVCCSFEE